MSIMIPVEKIRRFTDLISPITDEAIFNVSQEGISVSAVDKSTVAMIDTTLMSDAFGSLPDDSMMFAVDISKLSKAFRLANKEDIIILTPCDGLMKIDIGKSLSMEVRLLDANEIREPRMPDISYSSAFIIPVSELMRIIRASDGIGYTLTFKISHKGVNIYAEGDIESVNLTVDSESIEFVEDGEYASTVGLDYIARITKALSSSDKVYVEMTQDHPIILKIDDDDIKTTYIIAPRIERD